MVEFPPGERLSDLEAADLARRERHLRMLAELAELGQELARVVQKEAVRQAAEQTEAAPRLVSAFAVLARTVGRLLSLEAWAARAGWRRAVDLGYRAEFAAEERRRRRVLAPLLRPPGTGRAPVRPSLDGADLSTETLDERLEAPGPDGVGPLAEIIAHVAQGLDVDQAEIARVLDIGRRLDDGLAGSARSAADRFVPDGRRTAAVATGPPG